MKKNKKNQVPATDDDTTTTTAAAVNATDIKTLVHSHGGFFDTLVELIPARFYLPSQDDKPWFGALSKRDKAKAKRKSIRNIKKARRDRLDPEKSSRTTLDFLKESIEKDGKSISDGGDGDGGDDGEKGEGGREVTYEELQMKLHRKIEALRSGRGGPSGGAGEVRREKRDAKKRKRIDEGKLKGKGKEKEEMLMEKAKAGEENKKRENERDSVAKDVAEAAKDIEFGKVKLAASIDEATSFDKKKKKRKLSKEAELKKALELEEAKKDPEKGEIVKKQHAWKTATDRAIGVKVHDDPNRLRKSLHKDMKKQAKSREKWKQRLETTEKMKKGKQEKRNDNIKAKVDLKKKAKIEKREKKLMRPGFEGRKEGFVTGN